MVLTYLRADQQSYWYKRAAPAKARESAGKVAEAESDRRRAERERCSRQLRAAVERFGFEEEERIDCAMDLAVGRVAAAAEREAAMMSAAEGDEGREGEEERTGTQKEGKRAARQAWLMAKGGESLVEESGNRRRRKRERVRMVMEKRRSGEWNCNDLRCCIASDQWCGFISKRVGVLD